MKHLIASTACSIPLAFASIAYAQTTPPPATDAPPMESPAPDTGMGATPPVAPGTPGDPLAAPAAGEPTETVSGWSVKDKVIGQSVYNENDEKVGDVTDLILTSDGSATHMIVGAGGFLGMGQHDVAIPFDEIQRGEDRLTLSGYTKDQLKALPRVELAE